MFRKKYIPIPATPEGVETYGRVYESLACVEFRDFLRVRISECASAVGHEIEAKGCKSEKASFLAGQMRAYEYLIGQAPKEMLAAMQKIEREKTSIMDRFSTKEDTANETDSEKEFEN